MVNWFSGPADNKVSINDLGNPAAIKAYRELTTGTGPFFQVLTPGAGSTMALPNTALSGTIVDGSTAQVVPTSVKVIYDGSEVAANPQKTGSKTHLQLLSGWLLKAESVHQVSVIFADSTTTVHTNSYQFTVTNLAILPCRRRYSSKILTKSKRALCPQAGPCRTFYH